MKPGEVDDKKSEMRARYRRLRRLIPPEERARIDEAIIANLVALPAYQEAALVLPYLSFGSEIDTYALVRRAWADGKTVALPRCVEGTRKMEWQRIESFDGLVASPIGVLEPAPDMRQALAVGASADELAVVPGLTFDARGFRLGYGGGFYDNFLAGFAGKAVGLCRSCQLSHDLRAQGVVDAHDVPVELVVTERGVL